MSTPAEYNPFEREQQQAKQIQSLFDSFVSIRSAQLEDLISVESYRNNKVPSADWLKEYVLQLLVQNDNLYNLAEYVRKGSTEYYWYSDFLDGLDKEDKKKYYFYDKTNIAVTKSSFDKSLKSVELPYFQEIVELVSALVAIKELEQRQPELDSLKKPESKLTFKSILNPAQVDKLTEGLNEIKLFDPSISADIMNELLSGDRKEKLQTTNTKLLYYFFQKLSDRKYISSDWWDIFLKNAILISARGKIVENQDFRGAKQKVFGENEGVLPKKHKIIDDYLDEIDDLANL